MWPAQRSNSPQASEVGAFGKLPTAGDFLQHGHPAGKEALLEWLEHGVGVGASRGQAWKDEFDAGAQKGFIFPADAETIVVGVMAPSRDQVGRRFPFVVFSSVAAAELRQAPFAAPLFLGSFLHAAGTGIGRLQDQSHGLEEVLGSVSAPDPATLPGQRDGYLDWCRQATLSNAGTGIFGGDWRPAFAYASYITIESLAPFGGQEHPPTPLAIRFPLGAGLAGAAALWLQIVQQCAGWQETIPCAVWSFDPESPSLTVMLGPPSPHAFADLWERVPNSENLSDLVSLAVPEGDFLAGVRPDLASLIPLDDVSVQQFVSRIRPS